MEVLQEYPSECCMSIAILLYLILISIYTGRFQNSLSALHKLEVQLKLEIIHAYEKDEKTQLIQNYMQHHKKRSYHYFSFVALVHLTLVFLFDWNLLQFLIPTTLFLFILLGNYWLKGRGVLNVLPDQTPTDSPLF